MKAGRTATHFRTVVGAVALLLGLMPAVAHARSADDLGYVQVATVGGVAGWVSNAYLRAHPGFVAKMQISAPDAGQIPMSHFGCNQSVCIDVEGQSTVVTYWATQVDGGNYTCGRPYFQVWTLNNHTGSQVHNWSDPVICAGAGEGVFYDSANNYAGSYPNKWSLCNVWAHISGPDALAGYPCANIIQ